jgi:hypothetical protein
MPASTIPPLSVWPRGRRRRRRRRRFAPKKLYKD